MGVVGLGTGRVPGGGGRGAAMGGGGGAGAPGWGGGGGGAAASATGRAITGAVWGWLAGGCGGCI